MKGRILRNEKGQALILVVGILAIVALLTSSALIYAKSQNLNAIRQKKQMQAYYIADAGITKAIAKIKSEDFDFSSLKNLPYGGGKIEEVTSNPSTSGSDKYKLTSKGVYPNPDDHPNVGPKSSFFSWKTLTAEIEVTKPPTPPQGWPKGLLDRPIWTDSLTVKKECKIYAKTYCSGAVDGQKELVLGKADKPKNLYANGNIDIHKDGKIYGSIFSLDGSIDLDKDFATISSSYTIQAKKDIRIKKHSVTGSILSSTGNVDIAKESQVKDIYAYGKATLAQEAEVQGEIKTFGDINIGNGAHVGGSVWTTSQPHKLNLGNLKEGQSYLIEGAAYVPDPQNYSEQDKAKVKGGIHLLPVPPGLSMPSLDFPGSIPEALDPALSLPELELLALGLPNHYFSDSQKEIDLSSGTWNGVYYVEGDLTLTCSTGKFSGMALFVAGGSLLPKKEGVISIANNTLISPQNKSDFLGLIAKNNIELGQENTISANVLWAGNKVTLSKNSVLHSYIICHELDAQNECVIEEPEGVTESVTVKIKSWH
jgi:hypothetical protein